MSASVTMPQVRYRSRSGLKALETCRNAAFLFPAGEALIDQIKMTAQVPFQCQRSPDAFASLMGLWGDRNPVPGAHGEEPPLFSASEGLRRGTGQTYRLKVCRGWLFSGDGTVRFNPVSARGALSLSLNLNPTRWIAAHGAATDAQIAALTPAALLRRAAEQPRVRSLDGNDNVLDRDGLGGTTFDHRPARRLRLLTTYMRAVSALLTERLAPQSPGNPRSVVPPELLARMVPLDLRLARQVEVYWELWTADPVGTVRRLRTAIEGRAPEVRWDYRVGGGITLDAPSIRLTLTEDVDLKVYAKTSERVRFEVEYRDHLAQIARRADASATSPVETLTALCSDAARRMSRTWGAIAPDLGSPEREGDLPYFVQCLAKANLGERTAEVFKLIRANGRLTREACPPDAIRRLVRAGVVLDHEPIRRGGVPCYPLAPRWRAMFERMRAA